MFQAVCIVAVLYSYRDDVAGTRFDEASSGPSFAQPGFPRRAIWAPPVRMRMQSSRLSGRALRRGSDAPGALCISR